MAGKLPSGHSSTKVSMKGGARRSSYQTPMPKGGSYKAMSGSKGRSSYQSLASSPKGRNREQ